MPCGWRACRLCRVRSGSLHPRRVPPPPWRPDVLQATQTQHRQSRVRLLRPHPSPGRPVVGCVTFDPSRCLMSAATHYFYLFPASLKTPLPLRHVGPLGPHRPAHPASPARVSATHAPSALRLPQTHLSKPCAFPGVCGACSVSLRLGGAPPPSCHHPTPVS